MRFKISNKKIVGINLLPDINNEFMPIDEFDNQEIQTFSNYNTVTMSV